MIKNILTVVAVAAIVTGCGSSPPPLTPEEIEARQRALAEESRLRRQSRLREVERLGLLELTDDEKVAFLTDFLSRLRGARNTGCDLVDGLGYINSTSYAVHCANGTVFVVLSADRDEIFATSASTAARMFGTSAADAVWFIGEPDAQSGSN